MIRIDDDGAVRIISLDRADRRNALTPRMLEDLAQAAAMAGADAGVGAIALLGEGRVFCAGFDLDLCREDGGSAPPGGGVMQSLLSGLHGAIAALRSCGRPVVVGAQGGAIAGGCALLGAGDLVVSDCGAKLGYPVVRLGVSPAVSAPVLAERIGHGAARGWLLDPALHTGAEAHALGLVDTLVETREAVGPEAVRLAHALAGKPAGAMRATRAWIREVAPAGDAWGTRALEVSLGLAGGEEERRLLGAIWGG